MFFVSFLFFLFSATIQAISAYLDAFQKIADAATNSRGNLYETKFFLLYQVSSEFIGVYGVFTEFNRSLHAEWGPCGDSDYVL